MAKSPKLSLASFTGVVRSATGAGSAADKEISLDLIDVESQVRTDMGDLTDLVSSIVRLGILEPLLVMLLPNGRYLLIAGERRYRSARLAGLKTAPVVIKHNLTKLQIREIQVTENNDREDLALKDQALGVAHDMDAFGFEETQKIWNRSGAWVSKRLAVVGYHPDVFALVQEKVCNDLEVVGSLNQMIALSQSHFDYWAARIRAGHQIGRNQVRDVVAMLKKEVRAQKKTNNGPVDLTAIPVQTGDDIHAADPQKVETAAHASTKQSKAKQVPGSGDRKSQDKEPPSQPFLTSLAPTAAERASAEKEELQAGLRELRKEMCDWGDINPAHINSMKKKMERLEFAQNEIEWVLWSSFLDMILPMLSALGPERVSKYMNALQSGLAIKSPLVMWRELHPVVEGQDVDIETAVREKLTVIPSADWNL